MGEPAGTTRTLWRDDMGGAIRRTVLPGGLRVVTESMPGARSASLGIWVGVGSCDEPEPFAGASHYLEHLLFKGTETRTAMEIASAFDAVGGDLNAFTSQEHTCYHAHVLAEDLPLALDIVGDVVLRATIDPVDVDNERGVILEEIAMRDDDPGDAVHDLFSEALYGDHPLGKPVLGTVESIAALRRDQVAGYYHDRYQPAGMVIAVAGRIDHVSVVNQVVEVFGPLLTGPADPDPARVGVPPPPAPVRAVDTIRRSTEQANLILGGFGLARSDDRRFALAVLSNALGGGMSSRLFQEVREKRGLAYSVYSFTSQNAGSGTFAVYAGCQPGKVDEVLSIVRDQLGDVAEHGLSDAEVSRGKGQVRGGLVLGLEDPAARMFRIGKAELADDEILSVDDLLGRIEAVTPDAITAIATELLRRPSCLTVVGPFDPSDFAVV